MRSIKNGRILLHKVIRKKNRGGVKLLVKQDEVEGHLKFENWSSKFVASGYTSVL